MDDARAVAGEYPLGGHRAINAWSLARAYGDDEPEYIVVGLDGVIEPSRTDFGGSGHRLPAIPIAAIGDRTGAATSPSGTARALPARRDSRYSHKQDRLHSHRPGNFMK
jgi:hypothetical protein